MPTPADKLPETTPEVPQPPKQSHHDDGEPKPRGLLNRAVAQDDANLADDYREFFARRKPRDRASAKPKS